MLPGLIIIWCWKYLRGPNVSDADCIPVDLMITIQYYCFTYLLLCTQCSCFPVGIHCLIFIFQSCGSQALSTIEPGAFGVFLILIESWCFHVHAASWYEVHKACVIASPMLTHVMEIGIAGPSIQCWCQLHIICKPCHFLVLVKKLKCQFGLLLWCLLPSFAVLFLQTC